MEEDLKKILEENLSISRKNQEILEKLQKAEKRRRIYAIVKWTLLVALIIFGIIQIQPYFVYWTEVINSIANNIEGLNNFLRGR